MCDLCICTGDEDGDDSEEEATVTIDQAEIGGFQKR